MLGKGKYGSSQSRLFVESDDDMGITAESDVWWNSEKDVDNTPSWSSPEGILKAREQKLKGLSMRSITQGQSDRDERNTGLLTCDVTYGQLILIPINW